MTIIDQSETNHSDPEGEQSNQQQQLDALGLFVDESVRYVPDLGSRGRQVFEFLEKVFREASRSDANHFDTEDEGAKVLSSGASELLAHEPITYVFDKGEEIPDRDIIALIAKVISEAGGKRE